MGSKIIMYNHHNKPKFTMGEPYTHPIYLELPLVCITICPYTHLSSTPIHTLSLYTINIYLHNNILLNNLYIKYNGVFHISTSSYSNVNTGSIKSMYKQVLAKLSRFACLNYAWLCLALLGVMLIIMLNIMLGTLEVK